MTFASMPATFISCSRCIMCCRRIKFVEDSARIALSKYSRNCSGHSSPGEYRSAPMLNAKAEKSITDIRAPEACTISNFHLCSTFLSRHLLSSSHYSAVLAITFYLCTFVSPPGPQLWTTLNYSPLRPTKPPSFSRQFSP